MSTKKFDAAYFNEFGKNHFPGYLGISIVKVDKTKIIAEMAVKKMLFAPNGFLHAGSIVTLADSVAGYATLANLPENGKSFTTVELKSNFIGAIREGVLECECHPEHLGRTTHVWTVRVVNKETRKPIALFSCTQLIL